MIEARSLYSFIEVGLPNQFVKKGDTHKVSRLLPQFFVKGIYGSLFSFISFLLLLFFQKAIMAHCSMF
jgi:hypothetical protein